jgi:ATP phosphoribosyltransferase
MITLALSKGRIFEETLPLLRAAGIEVLDDPDTSRKLILDTNQPGVRVLVVRASDVPTYVQQGGADLGITGRDTLIEHLAQWGGSVGAAGLYQPLDLGISRCRISVAVRADFDYAFAVRQGARLRVATKFMAIGAAAQAATALAKASMMARMGACLSLSEAWLTTRRALMSMMCSTSTSWLARRVLPVETRSTMASASPVRGANSMLP